MTTNYLNEQINEYKIKSFNSLKKAQEFAINNDLNFVSTNLFKESNKNIPFDRFNSLSTNKLLTQNVDIEAQRIEAANQIRNIDAQIKNIKELTNAQELQYIGSTIPALVREGLPANLKEIEQEIIERKVLYTARDEGIRKLEQRKILMINLLKKRAIGLLEAEKIIAKAKMEAATRPKDVFLRYKELFREAERDENTQVQLENQLRVIKLEKAKYEKPWELITEPTLLNNPVGPKKTKNSFTWIVYGPFIRHNFGSI